MSEPVARPGTEPSALTAPFWAAAAKGLLVVQRCVCGEYRHYPRLRCPACASGEWDWAPVTGRGVVYSFTVTLRPFHPAWRDRAPYAIATVELDEGVRMVSDLPDEDTETVRIGAPVEVFFDDVGDRVLPRFRLVRSTP